MSKKQKHKQGCKQNRGMLSLFNVSMPHELRIPSLVDATGLHAIKVKIMNLEAELSRQKHNAESKKSDSVPPSVVQAITQIATNAWRAKIKMVDPSTGEAKEDVKRIYRHIEAIFDTLKQLGVDTVDPTGKAYDSGMALKVISFEQTPGYSKETIKETVKPSIVWQGQLIQMGEVIVGTAVTTEA